MELGVLDSSDRFKGRRLPAEWNQLDDAFVVGDVLNERVKAGWPVSARYAGRWMAAARLRAVSVRVDGGKRRNSEKCHSGTTDPNSYRRQTELSAIQIPEEMLLHR